MKWINASERLPEGNTRVIVRWTTSTGGPYIEIGDAEWISAYELGGHYAPESLDRIEWLDESESTPSEKTQKVVEYIIIPLEEVIAHEGLSVGKYQHLRKLVDNAMRITIELLLS